MSPAPDPVAARLAALAELNASPRLQAVEMALCSQDVCDWLSRWGWTLDPREAAAGRPAVLPFDPFPRQVEFLRWLESRESAQEDGLVEKSREVGVTWLCCAFALHRWLFRRGYKVGFGSRKWDLVDRKGDPDCIFEKLRFLLDNLPAWMRPPGFDPDRHDAHAKLINPHNGSAITGEGGDEIGRGGRAQPLGSKILTPTGWATMGDLKVGDLVIGAGGKPIAVTGVFPRGFREVFKVTFRDGAVTECCDEHLWHVTTPPVRKARVRGPGLYRRRLSPERPVGRLALYDGWRDVFLGALAVSGNVMAAGTAAAVRCQTAYRVRARDALFAEAWDQALSRGRSSVKEAARAAVLPLSEIRVDFVTTARGHREHRYQVPLVNPVEFAHPGKRPLDPYLLGAILGDGTVANVDRTSPGFSSADPEMVTLVGERLPACCGVVSANGAYDYRLVDLRPRGGRGCRSPLKEAITALGLAGVKGPDKFIPEAYEFGPPADRLELLRGLLDTDGWVVRRRGGWGVRYSSVSRSLADGVRALVRSLGGTATCSRRAGSRRVFPQGRACDCLPSYEVRIAMPRGMNPFRLSRKADLYVDRVKYLPCRPVVSVEPAGMKECRCITVDSPDGLYVTDDFIVTHNSTIFFVDEAASLPHPQLVDRALSQTTRVRIDVSTPKGPGNPFAHKRFSGRCPVFTFRHQDDPRKGPDWYANECERLGDPVLVAQELDIDYSASVEGIAIPGAWVRAAVGLQLPPSRETVAGWDVAEEGRCKNVLIARKGPVVLPPVEWGHLNTTEGAWKAADEAERAGATTLYYDVVGPGMGVKGAFASGGRRLRFLPAGVNGGDRPTETLWPDGRTSRERFHNLRAELWWLLRCRFERAYEHVTQGRAHRPEDMVSVPDHPQLIAQLSLPLWRQTDRGRLKLESKDDMRRRGVQSPDFADALALAFAPRARPQRAAAGGERPATAAPGGAWQDRLPDPYGR